MHNKLNPQLTNWHIFFFKTLTGSVEKSSVMIWDGSNLTTSFKNVKIKIRSVNQPQPQELQIGSNFDVDISSTVI